MKEDLFTAPRSYSALGPKPEYWSNTYYRTLVERWRYQLLGGVERRAELKKQRPFLRANENIVKIMSSTVILVWCGIGIALVFSKDLGPVPLASLCVLQVLQYLVKKGSELLYDREIAAISTQFGNELSNLDNRAAQAEREIL